MNYVRSLAENPERGDLKQYDYSNFFYFKKQPLISFS